MQFSPDGQSILVGDASGTGTIRDTRTQLPRQPTETFDAPITAVSFSDNGGMANVACSDGAIRSWRVPAAVEDDEELVRLWMEVSTMHTFNEDQRQPLSRGQLHDRILRLLELGNVPGR